MSKKEYNFFWEILDRFNFLMKECIEGPNCTDPKNCHGDCCSIKIDVPKVLAEWYIEKGYAVESDFIRSDIFSFHLRFNETTGKCFLFDKTKNGCRIHNTGRKPPQCWIYPTGFSNKSDKTISCKRLGGWKIINIKYAQEAEILLKEYVFLCQIEALKERNMIKNRLKNSIITLMSNSISILTKKLKSMPPSNLGGFKDSWNDIECLSAEGYSLQMKKFCKKFNPMCELIETNFLNCERICDQIIIKLIEYLNNHLIDYVRKNGSDSEGDYPLFKLFENYLM